MSSMFDLCREHQVRIVTADFSDYAPNISGFFCEEENKIYINKNDHPQRQIFVIAHELAHKILHEEYICSKRYLPFLRGTLGESANKEDKEANNFARNLLIPPKTLKKYRLLRNEKIIYHLFDAPRFAIRDQIKKSFLFYTRP